MRSEDSMDIKKDDARVIRGWSFFDWANSAYALVISTAVFPPFFFFSCTREYVAAGDVNK